MNKLHFYQLDIEITRRCNLACPHCMRGDAENVDISTETIDKLLDRTCRIDWILLTGGEPTLNYGAMRYLLDGLIKRKIPLKGLCFVTNGIVKSKELVKLFYDFSYYIHQYNAKAKKHIDFAISQDRYHGTDTEEHYKYWFSAINQVANVRLYEAGEFAQAVGKGKDFPKGIVRNFVPCKVCYRTHDKSNVPCIVSSKEPDGVLYIPCSLTFDCYGNFYDNAVMEWKQHNSDNVIFTVDTENITEAIDKYNVGKPLCQIAEAVQKTNNHVLKNVERIGAEATVSLLKFAEINGKAMQIINPDNDSQINDEWLFKVQYEQSTQPELVRAAFHAEYGDAVPEEVINPLSTLIINRTLSELKEKYRGIEK